MSKKSDFLKEAARSLDYTGNYRASPYRDGIMVIDTTGGGFILMVQEFPAEEPFVEQPPPPAIPEEPF